MNRESRSRTDSPIPLAPERPSPSFLESRFRLGGGFELVVFDRLEPPEQAALAELRLDPHCYGLLRPRAGSAGTWKAVDRDLALLLLTLREPGPLPFFALEGGAPGAEQDLEQLVLDGVLEVERGGGFVSGPAALPSGEPAPGTGRLARLSAQALRYGAALGLSDPSELWPRLYGFHRLPLDRGWRARLADADAVLQFLAASGSSRVAGLLEGGWELSRSRPGWLVWTPRRAAKLATAGGTFKLYLSPLPSELPQVFAGLVELLAERGGLPFKVGSDAAGLARPDKLVVYLGSLEELEALAAELERRLPEVPPHGVPFTAEIGRGGLLSWGFDPPHGSSAFGEPESWRLWVVRRLAAALVAGGKQATPELPAWAFALERLRREGVDVERWTPRAELWRAA